MKNRLYTLLLYVIFMIGLSLVLYPVVSRSFSKKNQEKAITNYTDVIRNMNSEEQDALLEEATHYNSTLKFSQGANSVSKITINNKGFNEILKSNKTDVMGYIEIDKIDVRLPIYHGSSNDAISSGVGLMEWSSFPIGGESTHSVLISHRGLPSAKLFTDLDKIEIGDYFEIQVLKRKLYYQVDEIKVVKPDELDTLTIVEGEDLITLVTCTPYGINSHRLLIRGKRVSNMADKNTAIAEAVALSPLKVMKKFIIPIFIIMFIVLLVNRYINHREDILEKERGRC